MQIFELNSGWLDLWTIVHAIAGFAAVWGLLLRPGANRQLGAIILFLVFLGWEILEIGQGPAGFGGAESGINIVTDMIAAVLGGMFAFYYSKLPRRAGR